jgi:secretion/DNA translocation related TadE-like protein
MIGSETSREDGAASVLLVAVAAAALVTTSTLATASTAIVTRTQTQGAADAAAIAAAAVLAGLLDGRPCERAAAVAEAQRATVESCKTAGLLARVAVGRRTAVFAVGAVAIAGQPDASAIYRNGRDHWAQVSSVYGVPVGSPTNGISRRPSASNLESGRHVSACNNDQGVTCQARRSS